MSVATEHKAEATHREVSLAFTAGSEKGVIKLLKAAACLAMKPLASSSLPPLAAAATQQGNGLLGSLVL